MCLTTVAKVVDPLVIAHIIDNSVPKEDIKDMMFWGITFSLIVILSGILNYFQILFMAKLGIKIITKLKFDTFNHLLLLPISWFDKTPVGVLIARVESDCERVKEFFSQISITIITNVLFFIGMLIVLLYRDWKITITLFIPMTILIIITLSIIKYLTKYYKKSREIYAEISGRLTEYIQGINIIQLFNQQIKAEKYIEEKSREKQKIDTRAQFIEYAAWGVNDFLVQTVFIIIIVLAISPKIIGGSLKIGSLIIFIQYSVRLVWPVIQISENLNQIQRAFVSFKRVLGLLEEETEYENNLFTENAVKQDDTFDFKDSIEFKNVWFKYSRLKKVVNEEESNSFSNDNEETEWVLKDVSFKIKKGSRIAFVGASGSGKTTCMSLLCRFYDIQQGVILVDGTNIKDIYLNEWRSKIGLILQDIILFPGNLLENIRIYNNEITEEKVYDALQVARAKILLDRMDDDLTNEITERGQNLSMGERQLISFARAVCANPEIIIMDEATASIDAQTENMIHKSMNENFGDKTTIIVAHKLASVIDADEILLFENGEIIARGNHNTLLNESDEYKNLVNLHFLKAGI
jgi:ABC-type multidrug transport system fused ATPase/permease subunit